MTAGVLVLVVGPSGAGKDTLIAAARAKLNDETRFVFPRRIVTRAGSAFEDHETLTAEEFAAIAEAGGFALHWHAHGLSYGVPRAIDDLISAGKIVVCNVSRGAIDAAHTRFDRVVVIYIGATPEVRASRIAARGRDAAAGSRVDATRADVAPADYEAIIDNSGPLAPAIAAFTQAVIDIVA